MTRPGQVYLVGYAVACATLSVSLLTSPTSEVISAFGSTCFAGFASGLVLWRMGLL